MSLTNPNVVLNNPHNDSNLQSLKEKASVNKPLTGNTTPSTFHQIFPPNPSTETFHQNTNELIYSEGSKTQNWQTPTIHFYLRSPHSTKPQPLYAYIRTDGITIKLPLGVKALPSHWDKKAQRCIISPSAPIAINSNHTIANNVILEYLTLFTSQIQSLEYICNKPFEKIKLFKRKNKKENTKYMEKNQEIRVLIDAFNAVIAKKSGNTQNQYRTNIKRFRKYLDDNNIPSTFENMNYKVIYNYAREIELEMKIKSATNYLNVVKSILKTISQNPNINYDYDYKIEQIKIDKTDIHKEKQETENRIILIKDEWINALNNVEGLTEREKIVRDLFILKTYFGCRYSDLYETLKKENYRVYEGHKCIQFYDKKENKGGKINAATIILNELSEPLYNKYSELLQKGKLDIITTQYFNRIIKRIAKKSGAFNEIRENVCRRKNKIENLPLYELLASHDTRHTFITNCKLNNIPTEVIAQTTGHRSTEVIDNYYTHITAEQKLKNTVHNHDKYFNKLNNNENKIEMRNNDNTQIFRELYDIFKDVKNPQVVIDTLKILIKSI